MFLKGFSLRQSHLWLYWVKRILCLVTGIQILGGRCLMRKKMLVIASLPLDGMSTFPSIYLGNRYTELKLTSLSRCPGHPPTPVKPRYNPADTPTPSCSSNTLYISLGPWARSLMPYEMASVSGLQNPSLVGWCISRPDLIDYPKPEDDWTKTGSI